MTLRVRPARGVIMNAGRLSGGGTDGNANLYVVKRSSGKLEELR